MLRGWPGEVGGRKEGGGGGREGEKAMEGEREDPWRKGYTRKGEINME